MEGSSSVSDAALFPRPQLFELHLTAQVPEGRFEHFPQVSVGLQRLGYERLGPHLQDGLAEALRAAHQVPQQHARLFLYGGKSRRRRQGWGLVSGRGPKKGFLFP